MGLCPLYIDAAVQISTFLIEQEELLIFRKFRYGFNRPIKPKGEAKEIRKFKIPSSSPTTNKVICFPSGVIQQAEAAICTKNCAFTAFVIAAVNLALEDLRTQ